MPTYQSAPSVDGNMRTIAKSFDQCVNGVALQLVYDRQCRVASLEVRVSSAAPNCYVYLFDWQSEATSGTLISRSEMVPGGTGGLVTFDVTSDVDDDAGGFPFDSGAQLIATTNPEFAAVDVVPDPILAFTARVQIAPRPCSPDVELLRIVARASEQQASLTQQLVAQAVTTSQAAYQPPPQGSGYSMTQTPQNTQTQQTIVGRRRR